LNKKIIKVIISHWHVYDPRLLNTGNIYLIT
jgi:hypothetical protein